MFAIGLLCGIIIGAAATVGALAWRLGEAFGPSMQKLKEKP